MSADAELVLQRQQRQKIAAPLRTLTQARVALASTGISLGTREALDFARCHALARDAVHARLDTAALLEALRIRGHHPLLVRSAASDRPTYLRRPDLGRRLAPRSVEAVAAACASRPSPQPPRLAVILADGLSALAVDRHALPLFDALVPLLSGFGLLPPVLAEQARVALGDETGALLQADLALMLIGERPGLSAPDSLGAYITWAPTVGRTDAERNCISNIRHEGLDYETAAARIALLCREAARLRLTGTAIKESDPARSALPTQP